MPPIESVPPGASAELIQPPFPTPYWGQQGGPAFTVRATCTIKPPCTIDHVLNTLLDTSTWPHWNNFVHKAEVTSTDTSSAPFKEVNHSGIQNASDAHMLRPGVIFTEHVDMRGKGGTNTLMKLEMTTLEDLEDSNTNGDGRTRRGKKVVWLGRGYPDWALRSERVHEIYTIEGEGRATAQAPVHYDVFETFSGPVAWLVRVCVGGALVRRFGQWNAELKGYVEGQKVEHQ